MTEKIYQFKSTDEERNNFLNSQENTSDFIRNLVDDYRNGKLVSVDEKDLEKQMKLRKIRKLDVGIILDEIKIKKEAIESGYSPSEALQILKGKTAVIDTNQIQLLLHPDGRCESCNHIHMLYNKSCSRWDCLCEVTK